jgi:hypothetical protein
MAANINERYTTKAKRRIPEQDFNYDDFERRAALRGKVSFNGGFACGHAIRPNERETSHGRVSWQTH